MWLVVWLCCDSLTGFVCAVWKKKKEFVAFLFCFYLELDCEPTVFLGVIYG